MNSASINNNLLSIVQSIPDLLIILDKNGNKIEMFSGNPKYDFWIKKIKTNIWELFDKRNTKIILEAIEKAVCTKKNCSLECSLSIRKLKHYYSGNCQILDKNKVVIVFRDITEQIVHQNEMAYLATHDFLTNLPNRKSFQDKLHDAMILSKRSCKKIALLFIDLDWFKSVNDTYGHNMWDLLLIEIAKRLKDILRESDFVARIWWDEFWLALTNLDENEDYKIATKRIIHKVSEPYEIRWTEIVIWLSIWISIFPDHSTSSEELVAFADNAMYKIKQSWKNNFKVYKK